MGRRSRTRAREGGTDAGAGRAPEHRPGLASRLNPIKVPTRARTRNAAIAFAVASAVFAVLDLTTGSSGLRGAVIPLAILAVLWGVRAWTMPPDQPRERDRDRA
ncbi:MAG TPA: hypothetical protein VFD04_21510 [Actinomycetes bacterium]|jgi:hypothetical protein|nr:hypothetical protein [Actinomycetes bacterium]